MPAPTTKGPLSVLFGQRLTQILEARGAITYQQKGDLVGVTRQEVYNLLHARHSPTLDKVAQIAAHLGIDAAELIQPDQLSLAG